MRHSKFCAISLCHDGPLLFDSQEKTLNPKAFACEIARKVSTMRAFVFRSSSFGQEKFVEKFRQKFVKWNLKSNLFG